MAAAAQRTPRLVAIESVHRTRVRNPLLRLRYSFEPFTSVPLRSSFARSPDHPRASEMSSEYRKE